MNIKAVYDLQQLRIIDLNYGNDLFFSLIDIFFVHVLILLYPFMALLGMFCIVLEIWGICNDRGTNTMVVANVSHILPQ